MKLVTIPPSTRYKCLIIDRKLNQTNETPWWRITEKDIPRQGILARSTGNGPIKKGAVVFLIGGHDRTVFLGSNCDKFKIHEYVGLVDGTGWQPLVQLGRDVEMTP